MRLRPLIIGTFLALCFWGLSLIWNGAGNAQRQNPPHNPNDVADRAKTIDILVTFDGEISKKGQVVIQLFRDPKAFENQGRPLDECFLKLDLSDEILWEFRGLPPGEYAISAFHDENENWKIDAPSENNPGEKACFSGVSKPGTSRPTFEQCKFPVVENRIVNLKWN